MVEEGDMERSSRYTKEEENGKGLVKSGSGAGGGVGEFKCSRIL